MNVNTLRASEIVRAAGVVVGDWITETDTPEGPFYLVAKVNEKSLLVYLDPCDSDTVRLPIRSTDAVRREV